MEGAEKMMVAIHEKKCKNLSPITDPSTGEITCGTCGSVILERGIEQVQNNGVFQKKNTTPKQG